MDRIYFHFRQKTENNDITNTSFSLKKRWIFLAKGLSEYGQDSFWLRRPKPEL